MQQQPAERLGALARAGFTLVEVLIAMIIAGLLTGVIFQLMQGQASFVSLQSARQEVQQNARGTLDLISSELRAVPPGAIMTATTNTLQFYLPRVWGITCQDMTGGGTVWVLFPEGAFPADFPATPGEDWKLMLPVDATSGGWRPASVTGAASGTPDCPEYDLRDLRNVQGMNIAFNGAGASVRQEGTQVYIGQRVTYETGTGSGSSRIWVKRNNGASAPQVMAGPLAGGDGLVFEFWRGATKVTPPGTSTTGFPCLTAIQAKVTMESTGGVEGERQSIRDSTRVSLRNYTGGATC